MRFSGLSSVFSFLSCCKGGLHAAKGSFNDLSHGNKMVTPYALFVGIKHRSLISLVLRN
jgi:hypothetical protein